ncbi:GNAT family N-acetyltransferase [Alteromonas sp. P256]|jgi:ribosomal protein S18 acetylase RimI-like enzyme|uniref:GNAT family N-acetyltransferase n=1 Tax=Alteromonas sp. P256 TaxID=3117399 RepID=UPI002FE1443E
MEINIRQGVASDAPFATPLILSAAEPLLNAIFGHAKDKTALGYLTHAWQLGGGQYGFENHWVAEKDNQILGLVTAWHSKLGVAFDRATLDSITSYFTLDEAIAVVMRNQTVAVNLTPPSNTELMIGHLAVAESGKRQGIGRSLVNAMQAKATELQKRHIVLDVEVSNTTAIRFYQSLGFSEETINKGFIRFNRNV